MQSIEYQIIKKITQIPKGKLLFPSDFIKIGSDEAIRVALHRLVKNDFIKRIAQGIYVRPETSEYIGEITPSVEEVAQAIAKRDRIRIIPTGAYALHALGLSTQIPLNIVFLTDGAPRTINIGKRTIKLKKTTPKNLLVKGKITSLVMQALREIGQHNLTELESFKIVELLKKEDKKDLKFDIDLAPAWIKKIMKKAL